MLQRVGLGEGQETGVEGAVAAAVAEEAAAVAGGVGLGVEQAAPAARSSFRSLFNDGEVLAACIYEAPPGVELSRDGWGAFVNARNIPCYVATPKE